MFEFEDGERVVQVQEFEEFEEFKEFKELQELQELRMPVLVLASVVSFCGCTFNDLCPIFSELIVSREITHRETVTGITAQ